MSGYLTGVLALLAINVIFAYGIFITAAAGQLNLGGAGFQAIGAYGCALLGLEAGLPPGPAIALAALLGGAVGFLISFPVLRTRGVYMVLATFAFAEVVAGVILNSERLGGSMGLILQDYVDIGIILPVAGGVVLFAFYLMSTRVGLAMRAIHDDEAVAELMGVHARAVQVGCFALGGALAALSGALYALYYGFVEAQVFGPLLSIFVLLYVLIGGTQTAWGPLVGAAFFTLLPEGLRSLAAALGVEPELGRAIEESRFLIFGVIIVAMMILRPQGIVTRDLLERMLPRRRRGAGHG